MISRRAALSGMAGAAAIIGAIVIGADLRQKPAASVSGPLVIYSTTDTAVFEPVLADFRRANPGVEIAYLELDATPMHERVRTEINTGRATADLLLSSAADLQVELVNAGLAAPHRSANAAALPRWARWRDEAFGFTFEPAVMVFNQGAMENRPIPRSRPELIAALNADPNFWRGRIGTYDIARSHVGYMLASQDARQSSNFGPLLAAFGALGVRTVENAATLLDALDRGEMAMAYNVLGSYALARVAQGARLTIVYPRDYTLAVSRTAIIPRAAPHPDAAHAFLEFLLSTHGQQVLAGKSFLSAVRPEIAPPSGQPGISALEVGQLRPIGIGPGLLVYLDRLKRERLIETWTAALGRTGDSAD